MIVTDPQHALAFGALDLIGADTPAPFWFETIAEGTDWGNPAQTVRAITTFLQDGAIQVVDGYENREMTLEVRILGEDSYALAAGELALMAEVGKRNTLVWTPPNIITGSGAPCVFDVVSSRLDHSLDDMGELRFERSYKLTVTALPWARSETLTTIARPAGPSTSPVVVAVDTCSSTSGWVTGSAAGVTTSGGSVRVHYDAYALHHAAGVKSVYLQRNGLSVPLGTGAYLRIRYTAGGSGRSSAQVNAVTLNGVAVPPTATNGDIGWYYSTGTVTTVRVSTTVTTSIYGIIDLAVADISYSDLPQDAAGTRQTYQTLTIGGSARTQGNLRLEDPSAALGSVLVYTVPSGSGDMQPPLRAHLATGPAESVDLSTVSTKRSDIATPHYFRIPALSVRPGGYLLMARLKVTAAGAYEVTYAGTTEMGTTPTEVGAPQVGRVTVTLPADEWAMVQIAKLTLPTTPTGADGVVRIYLDSVAIPMQLDEAWLFNVDAGRLSWVECGSGSPVAGGPASRVWLDAASLGSPVPAVSIGTDADRSDSFGAGAAVQSFAAHDFTPPEMNVFTVTSASVSTGVTLDYHARYHTHVVE